MTDELKDLITKLLDKDPKTRLGSTTDADEVVNHPWFRDLDWESLMKVKPLKVVMMILQN